MNNTGLRRPLGWVPEVTSLLLIVSATQISADLEKSGIPFSWKAQWWWFVIGLWLLAIVFLSAKILQRPSPAWSARQLARLEGALTSSRVIAGSLVVLVCLLFPLITFMPFSRLLTLDGPRWFFFLLCLLAMVYPMKAFFPARSDLIRMLMAALLIGIVFRVGIHLTQLSTDPLSLGWSETSRYYYASLFFSRQIYGERFATSVLHPTRYLMQSLPFLMPQLGLFAHRLWQVALWIGLTVAGVFALDYRLKLKGSPKRWWLLLWGILFMYQGPVYYHLMVMVVIVLFGTDVKKPVRTSIVVALASLWAGVSRLNWYPVPGMIAAVLYIVELQMASADWRKTNWKQLFSYWLWPLIWVFAGAGLAFFANRLYISWSGNPASLFSSSFSSDLLWYRLFPTATYPLGVLTGTLLVSLPAGWVIVRTITGNRQRIHPLRWLALIAMLLVLMVGGLVVSTKIGGGSNLHNMDGYLVILWIMAAYIYLDRLSLHDGSSHTIRYPDWVLVMAVLIPVLFTLAEGGPVKLYNADQTAEALATIQQRVSKAYRNDQPVLFISERQLVTFGYIEDAPMEPDYEKVFLMEMAMAGNRDYLDAFHENIVNQRYAFIIADPMFDVIKDRDVSWGEENNAWVEEVSIPVMCYYFRRDTFPGLAVQILAPRDEIGDCTLENLNTGE